MALNEKQRRLKQLKNELREGRISRRQFIEQRNQEGLQPKRRDAPVSSAGEILGKEYERQEEAAAKEQNVEQARQQARENLRPAGTTVEEFRVRAGTATKEDTDKFREQELSKGRFYYDPQRTPSQLRREVSAGDVRLSALANRSDAVVLTEKEFQRRQEKTMADDTQPIYDSGTEGRIKTLLEREKRLEEFKNIEYEKFNIQYSPDDSWLKSQAKGAARGVFEFSSAPVYYGGRVAFTLDVIRTKEGRKYVLPWNNKQAIDQSIEATKFYFNPQNPMFLFNIATFGLAVKGAAANAPDFISKASSRYVPLEDVNVKIVESTTQPYSFNEILGQQGKTVTGIHASFSDLFGKNIVETLKNPFKGKTEATVKAFPEQAKGFRKAIGQYSFYKSLPEKATGQPQAYTGYVGITETLEGSVPKVKYSLGEPKRFLYLFEEETIQPLSAAEKAAMRSSNKVLAGRAIMEVQKSQPGESFLAAENLLKTSTEGQYVSPEGTVLEKVGEPKFTIYKKYSVENPLLRKVADITGVGKKSYRLEVIKVKSTPGEVAKPSGPAPLDTTPIISKPVSVASIPVSAFSSSKVFSSPFRSPVSQPSKSISKSILKTSLSVPSRPSGIKSSPSVSTKSAPVFFSPAKSASKPSRSIGRQSSGSLLKSTLSYPRSVPSFGSVSAPQESFIVRNPPKGLFKFPKIRIKEERGSIEHKKYSKSRFVPSFTSFLLNIFGKGREEGTFSGFEERPIPLILKKKRKGDLL